MQAKYDDDDYFLGYTLNHGIIWICLACHIIYIAITVSVMLWLHMNETGLLADPGCLSLYLRCSPKTMSKETSRVMGMKTARWCLREWLFRNLGMSLYAECGDLMCSLNKSSLRFKSWHRTSTSVREPNRAIPFLIKVSYKKSLLSPWLQITRFRRDWHRTDILHVTLPQIITSLNRSLRNRVGQLDSMINDYRQKARQRCAGNHARTSQNPV